MRPAQLFSLCVLVTLFLPSCLSPHESLCSDVARYDVECAEWMDAHDYEMVCEPGEMPTVVPASENSTWPCGGWDVEERCLGSLSVDDDTASRAAQDVGEALDSGYCMVAKGVIVKLPGGTW